MKLDCEGKNMNKTMLLVLTVICVVALSYYTSPAFGDAGQHDHATCDITVTVESIVEWEGVDNEFPGIALANITAQNSSPSGSAVLTLWTNSNVTLTADNTNLSQLTHQRGDGAPVEDTLVTWYKISTDGDGDPATGADSTAVTASASDVWTLHNLFLTAPLASLAITHFNGDGNVEVTLEVQATNEVTGHMNVADVGLYEATQTITATWASEN
jgi:hypothetical protein